jgi:hypothetical protein
MPDGPLGSTYNPVAPTRVLDTRSGNGGSTDRLGSDAVLAVKIAGRGGVPASGVSAVVLTVTAVEANGTGFLTAWPTGLSRPLAANLNFSTGMTVPNVVVVPMGALGRISLSNHGGSTDVAADVVGWFGSGG